MDSQPQSASSQQVSQLPGQQVDQDSQPQSASSQQVSQLPGQQVDQDSYQSDARQKAAPSCQPYDRLLATHSSCPKTGRKTDHSTRLETGKAAPALPQLTHRILSSLAYWWRLTLTRHGLPILFYPNKQARIRIECDSIQLAAQDSELVSKLD